jgi:hypothetical protein
MVYESFAAGVHGATVVRIQIREEVITPYMVMQRSSCFFTIMQHSAWPTTLQQGGASTRFDSVKIEVHISNN